MYDAKGWSKRDINSATDYLKAKNDSTNSFLWDKIELHKYESYLELGSNAGNRLIEIAKRNSKKQFYGIDLNPIAISKGMQYVENLKLSNLKLNCIDIRSKRFLEFINSHKFECAFSWATLMYIHPAKIYPIVKSIVEHSKLAIIIEADEVALPFSRIHLGGAFSHNYMRILRRAARRNNWKLEIEKISVPRDVWNPGNPKPAMYVISRFA